MKKIVALLSLAVIVGNSFGQDNKIYHSIKYGIYSEYQFSPMTISGASVYQSSVYNTATNQYEDSVVYFYDRQVSISMLSFVYTFRYNLLEPSDNFGLGINASPCLGLSISDDGFGSINLPAYLTANFGAGSTYNTAGNFGGYIGIGYEFTKINLVGSDPDYYDYLPAGTAIEKPKTSWAEPVAIAGIRWWTKSNRLMELSLKYGFGSNGDLPAYVPQQDIKKPKTIQITWGWFINY